MSQQTKINQSHQTGQPPPEIYKVEKNTISVYDETLGKYKRFPLETRVKVHLFLDHQEEWQGLVQVEPGKRRPALTGVRALALASEIIGATLHIALNDILGEVGAG